MNELETQELDMFAIRNATERGHPDHGGLAVEDLPVLRFEGAEAAEVLLFDLP